MNVRISFIRHTNVFIDTCSCFSAHFQVTVDPKYPGYLDVRGHKLSYCSWRHSNSSFTTVLDAMTQTGLELLLRHPDSVRQWRLPQLSQRLCSAGDQPSEVRRRRNIRWKIQVFSPLFQAAQVCPVQNWSASSDLSTNFLVRLSVVHSARVLEDKIALLEHWNGGVAGQEAEFLDVFVFVGFAVVVIVDVVVRLTRRQLRGRQSHRFEALKWARATRAFSARQQSTWQLLRNVDDSFAIQQQQRLWSQEVTSERGWAPQVRTSWPQRSDIDVLLTDGRGFKRGGGGGGGEHPGNRGGGHGSSPPNPPPPTQKKKK